MLSTWLDTPALALAGERRLTLARPRHLTEGDDTVTGFDNRSASHPRRALFQHQKLMEVAERGEASPRNENNGLGGLTTPRVRIEGQREIREMANRLTPDLADLLGLDHPPGGPPETRNAAPSGSRNGVAKAEEAGQLQAEIYDLLGLASTPDNSPLDRAITVTRFASAAATSQTREATTLRQFGEVIRSTRAAAKSALPWCKLAIFGDDPTAKGSLRHDANPQAVEGVEGDYDAGAVTVDEAAARLETAGVAALIYTTPSHRPEAPRWRVLAPLSATVTPSERAALTARLNGALSGILAPESFTPSQAYYFGALGDGAAHEVRLVEGAALDTLDGLPSIGRRPDRDEAALPNLDAEVAALLADDDDDLMSLIAPDWARIKEALAFIPADDRDDWLRVGMALHAEGRGGDEAEAVWREWSRESDKFDARDQARVWRSFADDRGRAVGIGSLYDLAKAHGWSAAPVTIDGFALSEDGVALAFAARHAGKLRFCHSTGRWFIWTGTHWRREETQLAFSWARDICRELASANPDSAAAKALAKANAASAVERFARADPAFAVTADAWDADPWLVATPGGTIDLRTGDLRPSRPADGMTRLTASAPVPRGRFDPMRDCPRWLAFLDQATGGDADAMRFLQQWAGYSLTGDTREEALLFVYGPGGSGKSTAINTLGDLFGDYATNVATETLTASKYDRHSTEIARLKGARFARASETEQGRAWAEQRIKALTGGDKVTARFMRQDDFEFTPEFKLTIVGNHAPALQNVDDAIRRRFNVLPFEHRPARVDHGLKEALAREFPGILAWCVAGCLDWQQRGLQRPEIVRTATAAYFDMQDSFAAWLDDCCAVGPNEADTAATLWDSWSWFARQGGEDPGSKNKTFPDRMRQAGFASVRDVGGIRGRGFKGVRVIADLGGLESL